MGELIRREKAAKPTVFSGERLTAAVGGQIEIEHYHRYLLARDYCRNLDVLDCASGEGYGSALLAQVARSVIGVEIDNATVEAAQSEFSYPNLRFQQGDARAIPLPDDSVDVAVSFETLEHLVEQDQFLSELHRVLRPDGLLIISTPDRDVYSPVGSLPNPFHKLELTAKEFQGLLNRHFVHSTLSGQRAVIGSVIAGAGQDAPIRSFDRRSDTHIEGSDHLARATYLVALASDSPVTFLRNSVYVYRADLDTDPQIRFEAEVARSVAEKALAEAEQANAVANAQVAEVEQRLLAAESRAAEGQVREQEAVNLIAALQRDQRHSIIHLERYKARLSEEQAIVTQLENHCAELDQQIGEALARANLAEQKSAAVAEQLNCVLVGNSELQQHANDLAYRLDVIEHSTIWRSSYLLRQIGARSPRVARTLRIGLKLVWWTATLQLPRRYRVSKDRRVLQLHTTNDTKSLPPAQHLMAELTDDTPIALKPVVNAADIQLPHANEPLVSVIICTYGQLNVTLACLKSIAEHPPAAPIEVIVVDDAYSGPEDMTVLQKISGILLVRNAVNLGFLLSSNSAARVARGRYIYMLNNDTEVRQTTIDALVEVMNARPDIGMAGSKLLFPNGVLQEAGGILWADATGWNFGRGEDPNRPEFSYMREVDYCSGASIIIRRDLFDLLGGFDESFAPAYYEDCDLAFRIRASGLKVVYQPESVVIHHEGVSHGTATTAGVKAHQLVNQKRMLSIWEETLARDHYQSGKHVIRARDRAKSRKMILIIEHYALEPDRDAGSRSLMGVIESLIEAGWVIKFWPLNRAYSPFYTRAMERRGIEMLDHRWPGNLKKWMQENGMDLDHVLIVRPDAALEALPAVIGQTNAVLSYYGVDLHFARLSRQAVLEGDPARIEEAAWMERLERRIWRNFDVVIYPSDEEAAVVREMSPSTTACSIVPFSFDIAPRRVVPVADRSVLFVAGFAHPPNVDAAKFLMLEVIPRLEARVGLVQVTLAGSNPTQEVLNFANASTTVTGYVTDEELSRLYNSHRASIVPLRFGAGVKGKVVESLSYGLPLVTTSIGAQGIVDLDKVVAISDDADGLAAALARLLTDDDVWIKQSHEQTSFAGDQFSRSAVQRSVLQALEAGEFIAAKAYRHSSALTVHES